jgi:hypothetical protein
MTSEKDIWPDPDQVLVLREWKKCRESEQHKAVNEPPRIIKALEAIRSFDSK